MNFGRTQILSVSPPQARLVPLLLAALACSPGQVGCEPRVDNTASNEEGGGAEAPDPLVPRTDGSAIEHTLRFSAPGQHRLEMETVFTAEGTELEVMMAVWAPGSYLVREFSRHVQHLRATSLDGAALSVVQTAKNRWRIREASGDALPERVVVRYEIYAREASVRTNFIDADLATLHGAATFLVPVDRQDAPHDVRIELPEQWSSSVTALDPYPEESHRYLARDFDELLDSPIALGNPSLQTFEVQGVEHLLATFGGNGIWDDEKAGADVQRIVEEEVAFWGTIPYRRYVFINLLLERGGGLEHRASTVMMASRWATEDEDSYRGWLGLVSHEFFHTWNVKRLRPRDLGPFDFENENYTRDLWIVEGITSYYDDLLLRRAGLLTDEQYFARIAKGIGRLQATPGRWIQSLSASSFNAWIHFYRHDENSRNSGVSYYTKGALAAWLLDARIRHATGGQKSLDDAMRLAYSRFSGDAGYTSGEIRALFEEVAGESLEDFWRDNIDGTGELDYGTALREFALQFPEADPEEEAEAESWAGLSFDDSSGRLMVREVVQRGPAYTAGINVGDELIALGEERLPADYSERFDQYDPDETVAVLLSRRGRLRRIDLTLGTRPQTSWTIESDPDSSPGARRHQSEWLGQ